MKNINQLLMTILGLSTAAFTYAQMPYPYTPYPGCPIPCKPCEYCCEPLPDLYNYGVQFGTVGCQTQRLIFSGLIQTQYQFIHVNDKTPQTIFSTDFPPTDVNNFLMRRVRLGFEADLGECWKGVIVFDFAGKNISPNTNETITTNNKHGIFGLYNAYIEKYYCNVFLRAGYKKVNFIYEENIEDYDLKTIERSIATNFFDETMTVNPGSGGGLGFGAQHVGIFVDSSYKGFSLGGALINGYQGTSVSSSTFFTNGTNNELGYFAYASYETTCNCVDIEIGCNVGFKPKGNNLTLSDTIFHTRGSIFGWNPYIVANWNCFYCMAEIIGAKVEKGGIDGITDADPIGSNLLLSYTWRCLEFVGRLSYLNTDRRGTQISTIINNSSNTVDNPIGVDIYNKAFSAYGGINYYMLNGAIKFSAGYEYAKLKDRHSGLLNPNGTFSVNGFTEPFTSNNGPFSNAKSYVHSVRAQLQLVF